MLLEALISIINNMKNQYIGVGEFCTMNCFLDNKQNFHALPHTGKHEVYQSKDLVKKLTSCKILTITNLIQEYTQLINMEIQKFIQKFERMLFGLIIQKSVVLTKGLIETFKSLGDFDYEKLSCQQVKVALSSVNKACKQVDLQNKAKDFYEVFKAKMQQLYKTNPTPISLMQKNIINISQNKKQQQNERQTLYQQSSVTKFENDNNDISLDFSNGQNNDQSQFKISYQSLKFDSDSQNQSIINTLNKFDEEMLDFNPPKEEMFFSKDNLRKKKKIEEVIDNKTNSQSETPMDQPKKLEMKSEISFKTSTTTSNQENRDLLASYVQKTQGRYYIKVAHLMNGDYKSQKAIFNIKLKVVQQLMFRKYLDTKTGRSFPKVKFIGGDETGIVVCYTNYIPEIRKGETIILKDCCLTKFYNQSYEVKSDNCEKSEQKRIQQVNKDKSISRFMSLNPLIYSIQKRDEHWPSICGTSRYINLKKYNKMKLIAKVHQIIEYQQKYIACYIYDGTGSIHALIGIDNAIDIKQGNVYYFQKIQVFSQMYGKQRMVYLRTAPITDKNDNKDIGKKYVIEMNEFKYDDMQVPNISEMPINLDQ